MTRTDDANAVDRAAIAAAWALQRLEPGPLAELRRMRDPTGAPMFWRLAARHPKTIGCREQQSEWMTIVRILAILSDRGDPANAFPCMTPGDDSARCFAMAEIPVGHTIMSEPCSPSSVNPGSPNCWLPGQTSAKCCWSEQRARSSVLTLPAAESMSQTLPVYCSSRATYGALAEPYYRRLDRALWATEKTKEGQE